MYTNTLRSCTIPHDELHSRKHKGSLRPGSSTRSISATLVQHLLCTSVPAHMHTQMQYMQSVLHLDSMSNLHSNLHSHDLTKTSCSNSPGASLQHLFDILLLPSCPRPEGSCHGLPSSNQGKQRQHTLPACTCRSVLQRVCQPCLLLGCGCS